MIRWYFIGIVHKIRSILNKFNSYDYLKIFLFYNFDRNLKFGVFCNLVFEYNKLKDI